MVKPPKKNPKPIFNFELTQDKKSETNPLLIQQQFAEIKSVTSEYPAIYTDGSNDALKFVASFDESKFMICSDSLSCLLAIECSKTQNPFILKIVEIY